MRNYYRNQTKKSIHAFVLISFLLSFGIFGLNSLNSQTDISTQFEWGQMVHGGGWLTGMNIHPSGSPIFCRADVSGAYRWDAAKAEWKCIVTQESLGNLVPWEYWGCASITSAPSDNNRAYMAFLSQLYYSNNQGDNWTKASSLGVPTLEMGVNDRSGRFDGERLVVDPQNRDVVYYGSNQDGLLRSLDGGKNWSVISSPAKNTTDKGEYPGIIPIIDGSSSLINGRSSIVYYTNYNDGIYKSINGGDSYLKIHSTPANDLEITDQGVLYACASSSILRYKNNAFTQISPSAQKWTDITVNGSQVWVISHGGYNFYYSSNEGTSWTKINDLYSAVDVPWLPDGDDIWRSIGELEYNKATGNLWMSEGVGVWHSSNPTASTQTWESRTKGIGELVTFDIAVVANGQVAGCFADKAFIVTDNTGPAQDYYPHDFIAGWDLGVCFSQPNNIVVNIVPQPWNNSGAPPQLAYSSDNGQTFTNLNFPPTQPRPYATTQGSKVEIASNDPNNLVWLNFTAYPEASKLYYTTNRGGSWQQSNASNGFVQSNEHSAASYLAADPNLPNTFYFHDASANFFRSTDGGANFIKMSTSTPPGGFHAEFKLIPGHEGHVIYTPGMASLSSAQLFFSENRAASFTTIPNVTEVGQLAVGKAAPGASYPTIFIIGKVNGVQGVYMSTDKMQTWQYMTDFPTGRSDLITELEGDMNSFGDLYGGFKSSGIFYAKYTEGDPDPGPTYSLNVSGLNGSVTKSPDQANYTEGTNVTITATPNAGYQFSSWSGDASGTSNPLIITMNGNRNITANFSSIDQGNCSDPILINAGFESGSINGWNTNETTTISSSYGYSGLGVRLNGSLQPWIEQSFSVAPNSTYEVSMYSYVNYDDGNKYKANLYYLDGSNRVVIDQNTTPRSWTVTTGTITTGASQTSLTVGMYSESYAWNFYDELTVTCISGSDPIPTYSLNVSSANGSVAISPNQASYDSATVVTLTATADAGYQFDGWSGDATGTTNPLDLIMNGNKSIAANFSQIQQPQSEPFSGTPIAIPGTILCEEFDLGGQNTAYFDNDPNYWTIFRTSEDVDINAASADNSDLFIGYVQVGEWLNYTVNIAESGTYTIDFEHGSNDATGGKIAIDIDGQQVGTISTSGTGGWQNFRTDSYTGFSLPSGTHILTIRVLEEALNLNTLTFTCADCNQQPVTYNLSVSVNGNGSVNPAVGTYNENETVTITATPDAGYQFDGWSGDASGAANPIDITMDTDKNITANFSQIPNTSCGEILSGTLQHEICEPTEGQVYVLGEPIVIKSNFSSDITQVQAFHGSWQWIGSSSTSPYEVSWINATVGTHTLTVRGNDASGNRTSNNTVTIEVVSQLKSANINGEENSSTNIYPNPVAGNYVFISYIGEAKIQLYSMEGKLLSTIKENDGVELDVSWLRAGTYILRIIGSDSITTQKLIKQ